MKHGEPIAFRLAILITWLAGALFLVAPLSVVAIASFTSRSRIEVRFDHVTIEWYRALLSSDLWLDSALRSLVYGAGSVILAVAIGFLAAFSLRTASRFRPQMIVLFLSPAFVPAVVLGLGQYLLAADLGVTRSALPLVVGQAALLEPVAFIFSYIALDTERIRNIQVARCLGASPVFVIASIALPSILPALAASMLLCYMMVIDETVLSLFLAPIHGKTLARRMFDGLRYDLDPTVAALGTVLIAAWSIVSIAAYRGLTRED